MTPEIARYSQALDDLVDENIAQTKTVVFDGREIQTEYLDSYYMSSVVNHPIDEYIEVSKEAVYRFNHETGALIGFAAVEDYYEEPDSTMQPLTEEQRSTHMREIASKYVSLEDLTRISDERTTSNEESGLILYSRGYKKEVSGVVTTEGINITIDQYGRLRNMFIYTPGLFDNIEVPEIDFDACETAIDQTLNILYDSEKSQFEDLTYERTGDWQIGVNLNGDPVLNCSIRAEYKNKDTGADCHNNLTLQIDL